MGSSILMKICSSGTTRLTILRLLDSPTCDEQSNFENYSLFCVISVINVWRAHFAEVDALLQSQACSLLSTFPNRLSYRCLCLSKDGGTTENPRFGALMCTIFHVFVVT